MELLLAAESWPFTFAVIVVVLIGMLETVSLVIGISLPAALDHATVAHLDGLVGSWLGWLHVGKVPLLVLLVILLTTFALIGFALNIASHTFLGVYPHPLLSSGLALMGALPTVSLLGGLIARLIPKEESSAVSLSSLVGHVATVVNGTAKPGYPAQARVKTEQGQTFYVHVEPDSDAQQFNAGDAVLLVRQISGARFIAIANPRPDLLTHTH